MWKLSPHSLGSIQLIDLLTFSCAVYRQESLTYTLQCYSSLSLRPLNPAIFTNLLTKASCDNIFWELSFYGSRRLWNDLYCVEWDVKLYYTIPYHTIPFYGSRSGSSVRPLGLVPVPLAHTESVMPLGWEGHLVPRYRKGHTRGHNGMVY